MYSVERQRYTERWAYYKRTIPFADSLSNAYVGQSGIWDKSKIKNTQEWSVWVAETQLLEQSLVSFLIFICGTQGQEQEPEMKPTYFEGCECFKWCLNFKCPPLVLLSFYSLKTVLNCLVQCLFISVSRTHIENGSLTRTAPFTVKKSKAYALQDL